MMNTKELIKKFNIHPTKSLGQNFLTDENMVDRIIMAADITSNDLVIEIGPGVGSMTWKLALEAGWVTAIEIDKHLIPALTESLSNIHNITMINNDIMKLGFNDVIAASANNTGRQPVWNSIKVVANLPYYITTPIIMKLLEDDWPVDVMVFMVQKEVADRMAAKPGTKDYGALSVAVQYYSQSEVVLNVPPHCFIPQPQVDSSVVKLSIRREPPVELKSKEMFFKTVKAAFGQRRKTLVNALYNSSFFAGTKEDIKDMLKSIGINENQRGETLSIIQFAALSNLLFVEK